MMKLIKPFFIILTAVILLYLIITLIPKPVEPIEKTYSTKTLTFEIEEKKKTDSRTPNPTEDERKMFWNYWEKVDNIRRGKPAQPKEEIKSLNETK